MRRLISSFALAAVLFSVIPVRASEPTCFGRRRDNSESNAKIEALLQQILVEESKQTELLRLIEAKGDRGIMVQGGNIPLNPWSVPQLPGNLPSNPWTVPQLPGNIPANPATVPQLPANIPTDPRATGGASLPANLPALPPLTPPQAIRTRYQTTANEIRTPKGIVIYK